MGNPARAMEPENFIIDLNKAVWYMLRRGATFFFPVHLAFMADYIKAWQAQDQNSVALARAVGSTYRIRRYNPITTLLRAKWLPLALRQFTFTLPAIPLIFLGMSVLAGRGFYRMVRSSIRSIPPLLTAVVVVFVTSDAWRILGTGFSARPIALWVAFIIAAWLFLIRYRYWADIENVDMQDLLRAAGSKGYLNSFIQLGAVPQEMEKPADRAGRQFVYGTYMVLTLLSLLEIALAVAATLTVVGMILVSKSETSTLADGVHVYFTLPERRRQRGRRGRPSGCHGRVPRSSERPAARRGHWAMGRRSRKHGHRPGRSTPGGTGRSGGRSGARQGSPARSTTACASP
jgi:hypothetical protein